MVGKFAFLLLLCLAGLATSVYAICVGFSSHHKWFFKYSHFHFFSGLLFSKLLKGTKGRRIGRQIDQTLLIIIGILIMLFMLLIIYGVITSPDFKTDTI